MMNSKAMSTLYHHIKSNIFSGLKFDTYKNNIIIQKSTLKIVNVDTSISHDFVEIIFVFSCLHYLNCLPIIPKLSGLSIQSVYHKDTLSQEWTFQIKRTILTPGRDVFIIIDTDTFGFLTTIFVLTPSHPPI